MHVVSVKSSREWPRLNAYCVVTCFDFTLLSSDDRRSALFDMTYLVQVHAVALQFVSNCVCFSNLWYSDAVIDLR
jgi:hypothetical protein